ncbi:MAG: glycosyltransferase family 2 protein [Chloroflexi bacterium]|nr:glycosyltransferase family 2 protein [Chloroflexota bacterium]
MDLSIIVVNWNVKDYLERCLASLKAFRGRRPGLKMEILVIDNASTDNSVAMVKERFPQVQLIVNSTNRGLPAAYNQGINLSRGRYILLMNADTEVVEDALFVMADYLAHHPRVGMVGPQLLNSDGSVQSSRRRFPTLATAFIESTILQRYLYSLPLLKRYYCDDQLPQLVQDVDWLVGAFLAIRRETVKQVGGLDEGFFMYFEEVDWCHRIKDAGWQIVYLPTAKIVHHYGRSSDQDLLRRQIHFNASKCRYVRKYYGKKWERFLKVYLTATFLWQMLEEGTKLALRHKPRLRGERLRQLWKVIRTGIEG